MNKKFKHEIYSVLDASDHHDRASRLFNVFLIILICLNVLAVALETVESIYKEYTTIFYGFEVFSVSVFSVEYILRVWAITENERYAHPVWGRLKFMFTGGAVIDLLAILPFYLPMLIKVDLRFIRVLRLLRLLRILKISRYMQATKMITNVFKAKKEELVITLLLIGFLMVVVSSIMFYVEHDAQPDKFSSIPATMWWSVATLTTVGYGDMYPITVLGKTLASAISILGIGLVALPAGILASGFSEEMRKSREKNRPHCPHCNNEL
jgi:voltage-gated potassium channel